MVYIFNAQQNSFEEIIPLSLPFNRNKLLKYIFIIWNRNCQHYLSIFSMLYVNYKIHVL